MRGRTDGSQKKRLLTTFVLVGAALLFLYLYFRSQSEGESAIEYGSRSLRKLGSSYLGGDDESDLGSKQDEFKFGLDDEDGIVPKSFPVCDDRYSELIPCLDRHLIYQMRLKLDLSLMEHYERHCPLPERRFNCLIPPPNGYKVRFYSMEVENGRVGYRVIHVAYGTLSNGLD
ncbi:putative S-adenosyl-L-methionine-dependent methyltransferase [Helianthus annuus]|nr:putative S-adenosyl-L-methionine-dependent methyltransferase [Helianthus annuus]